MQAYSNSIAFKHRSSRYNAVSVNKNSTDLFPVISTPDTPRQSQLSEEQLPPLRIAIARLLKMSLHLSVFLWRTASHCQVPPQGRSVIDRLCVRYSICNNRYSISILWTPPSDRRNNQTTNNSPITSKYTDKPTTTDPFQPATSTPTSNWLASSQDLPPPSSPTTPAHSKIKRVSNSRKRL
jgi:hypothetical protein